MPPKWLHVLSWIALVVAFASAAVILLDLVIGKPQRMAVMNIVWPVTALYWGPVTVWGYWQIGRKMRKGEQKSEERKKAAHAGGDPPPTASQIAVSVGHCGAACTLGDIGGEFLVAGASLTIAGIALWSRTLWDFIFAWLLGIIFQYFVIKPMKGLPPGKAIVEAMKADTLSIVAFQIGMFIWMAFSWFVLFPSPHLEVNQPEYWFMMQIAMIVGFFTSWPANVFLLKRGIKEKMG